MKAQSYVGSIFRLFVLLPIMNFPAPAMAGNSNEDSSIWAHDNLVAWCAVLCDAKHRDSEDRAEMLQRLGFKQFAYDWRSQQVPTFDAEIEALKKRNINLKAWWLPLDTPEGVTKNILETFKRHNVHPQLWVNESNKGGTLPQTAEERQLRIQRDADLITALVKRASPYGCEVAMYNWGPWFVVEENQLAILDRLKALGVMDVGLVYNFSHARDAEHDDTPHFAELWNKMKPHVIEVNITGVGDEMPYPSQGKYELEMMRVIQNSGWRGPVGFTAEKGFGTLDTEIVLKNHITGLDWLAAELTEPGSGGPRPSF